MADIGETGGRIRIPPRGDRPGAFGGGVPPLPFLDSLGAYLSDPLERRRVRESLQPLPGEGLVPFLPPTGLLKGIGEFAETLPGFAEQNARLEGKLGPDIPSIIPGGALVAGTARAAKGAAKASKVADEVGGAARSGMRTVQQQIDALRVAGMSPEDAARTFNVAPETPPAIQTATTARLDPGKTTRAIQTALGQAEGGGMPQILADYSTTGPFAPKDLTKHGGVIGAATRAVMAGDQDVVGILGPDLTQQLAQGKIAQLARIAGASEDAIRSAFGIMEHAAAAVSPEVKATIRQAVRSGTRLAPESEQALFAAQHKALTQAGLPVTDDAIGALTDRLVAEARRVNKAVSGQTATLEQATQEGGSLFKAAGDEIVPAVPPGGGGPPPAPPTGPFGGAPISPRGPSGGEIVGSILQNLLNIPKTLRATLDISQLGRQGFIPLVSATISRSPQRRLIARNAIANAVRGYGDRYAGQAWEQVIKDPLYAKWREFGGNESRIPAKSLQGLQAGAKRDEIFGESVLDVIPGVGAAVNASNRSYALTLNALSFYSWKHGYQAIQSARAAKGGIVSVAEGKALANWYNVAAGRGRFISSDNKILNGIFWAPNLVVSRLATVPLTAKLLADPATREVGKIAAKDMAKSVSAGIGFLMVADASGLKVDWDPTSSTFGTVRVGNTTIDPWAGYRQPFVLAARIALDRITDRTGKQTRLSEGGFGQADVPDLIWRFLEGKFAPTPAAALAIAAGRDYVGQPFGPRGGQSAEEFAKSLAAGTVIPLSPAQVADAVIDDLTTGSSVERGLPPGTIGAVAGLANLTGVGVQTYVRPTMRDGLGREIGGDQAEPPPNDITLAWDALRERSVERAKASGGTPEVPELVAPDKYIGSGERRITLDDSEADRLKVLVGQERERTLGQIVSSPAFAALGPSQKQSLLLSAKTEADRAGQEAFAIELAKVATDDVARVRAARIGLSAASGTGDRMDFAARLAASGALTQEMEGAIDDLRGQTDPSKPKYEPSVGELLTWSANAQRYTAAPPWRVGDPQTWIVVAAQAKRLRGVYQDMKREADAKGVPIQTLSDYKEYARDYGTTKVGSYPIAAFISLDGDARKEMLSPQRAQIKTLPLWDRFASAIEARDPYAIR